MNDWNKVLDWLEPKPPLFCPEKPSLTQKVFLRTNAIEALFGGMAGGGKMVTLTTLIPTPDGFVKMADVHPGDLVLGRDGKPCTVLAESDIEFVGGYRFTFDDGSTADSNDEHLWLTFDDRELARLTKETEEWRAARRAKRASRAKGTQGPHKSAAVAQRNSENRRLVNTPPTGSVRTTAEIVATLVTPRGRRNHAIPVTAPIDLPERDLPIDPYVLGVWLGDGSKSAGVITSMDPEITAAVEAAGYPVSSSHQKENNRASNWSHAGLFRALRLLGVIGNKHIPHDYLWGSETQRLALLQGLMDTDGTVAKGSGSAEFCNTNQSLAEGVAHLARSLGMKATVREGRAKLNGKDCGPKWTVKLVANREVFRLERKRSIQKIATRRTTQFRYIVAAERIEARPMKCIRVSAPDHLYLVGEHFIPTHNSSALLMSALQFVDVPGYSAMLFRRTYADLALPGALMDRFINWISNYPEVRWNGSTYTATFPSSARISFGYLNNVTDYLRYKGPCVAGTEVLTSAGWKKIEDIEVGELVASMDPATRTWTYQPVTHTWIYDHDGLIYSPRPGSDVSFAVTENHTWWVSTQRSKTLKKYRTDELPKVARFPQAAHFVGGIDPGAALFPRHPGGRQLSEDLIFSAEDWATFLGWYIAEGCTNRSSVNVALHDQHSRPHKDDLAELLRRSGAHVYDTSRYLQITNAKLAAWLDEHTGKGAHQKRIPDEVFAWKTNYARLLLQSLVEGDGTWRSATNAHYVTTSRELADGVMRLAQHCGFRATLNERHDRTTTPDGKEHDVLAYHVFLLYKADSDTGISLNIDNEPIVSEHYTGTVHCLTVPPYHTFLTRHNGRVVWTGNSELQFIGMDEVTEIREEDYRYLFSRLRRPSSGPLSQVPLRMRAATNPAPNWVRQRFIVEGKEYGRIFVPSSLHDNPGVDAESYKAALAQLDPVERARLEMGDWWATTLGSMFSREDFVQIGPEEVPPMSSTARVVRFWDMAASEPSPSYPNPDYTVGTLMLFDQGIAYVLDVKRVRYSSEKVERLVAQTAMDDGRLVAVRMEQEPGSSGVALVDQYARYVLPGYDFGAMRATGDKQTRALPFKSAAKNGNVRVVRGSWLTEWLDEFSSFPEACPHDDQVDSCVGAFTYLTGLGLPQRKRAAIIV